MHRLRPQFGRYAGVLADILLDHALASGFDRYSDVPLGKFARGFYLAMIRNHGYLPGRIRRFMWHFITTDRLGKYATAEGIADSLGIMVRYRNLGISVCAATDYLKTDTTYINRTFESLFMDLQPLCRDWRADERQIFSRGCDISDRSPDKLGQVIGRDEYL